MKFNAIAIKTTKEGIEAVTGRLYFAGANGVEIDDSETGDAVCIKVYTDDTADGEELLLNIENQMQELKSYDTEKKFGSLEISVGKTDENEWANTWKQFYKPTRIGRHIVIVPEWEEYERKPGDVIITVDPGSAFGSGTHETTMLCIEFIEDFINKDSRVLDIGTGTGILAVTALLTGAKSAIGIDIDEKSVDVAHDNARLNGVADRFRGICGNLADEVSGKFELITANIVADAIISLSNDVPSRLAPNGIFICSGIISKREDDVRKALKANGLEIFAEKHKKDWAAYACKLSSAKTSNL